LRMACAAASMSTVRGEMNVVSFVPSLRIQSDTSSRSGLVPSHAHSNAEYSHSHHHRRQPEVQEHSDEKTPVAWLDRSLQRFKLYQPIRPLMIGIVHGLAGSAAAALLVLATIRNPRWAVAYLFVFGAGTIAGMMLITMSIASAFHLVPDGRKVFRRLALASGLLSLGFGIVVAYQILVVNGLLTGHPYWVAK